MAVSDHPVFVSHVSEDRPVALEIVAELERVSIRCWIAPRDVRPGRPFDEEIAEAIETSRAMLLVFSEKCNYSEYIRREVTVAGESHKPIIPFRIEDAQPRRGLRVRLSDLNWIDGFVARERAIEELTRALATSFSETGKPADQTTTGSLPTPTGPAGVSQPLVAPIFISHASKDRSVAWTVCEALENRGLSCWISSRDVLPGENFQVSIVRAIRTAKVMVPIFSANSNNSEEIKKELVLAGQHRLIVIPVRVEDVIPDEAFAYEFATRQWIDRFENPEQSLQLLARRVTAIARAEPTSEVKSGTVEAAQAEERRGRWSNFASTANSEQLVGEQEAVAQVRPTKAKLTVQRRQLPRWTKSAAVSFFPFS